MLDVPSMKTSAVFALVLAGCAIESAFGKTVSVVASSSSDTGSTVIINGKRYGPGEYQTDGTNVKYNTGKSTCHHKSVHVSSDGEKTEVVVDEDKECSGHEDGQQSVHLTRGSWSKRLEKFEKRVYSMGSEFSSSFGIHGKDREADPETKKENRGTGKPGEPRTVEIHDGGNYAYASSSGNGPHHEKATVTRSRSGTTTTVRASSSASSSSTA